MKYNFQIGRFIENYQYRQNTVYLQPQ